MGKRRQEQRAAARKERARSAAKTLDTKTRTIEAITADHLHRGRGQESFRGVNSRHEVFFEEAPTPLDFDERAAGEKHVRPTATDRSVNAPSGTWTDVPKGMVAAPDTYVDGAGVLRSAGDNSCVVWHNGRANCGPTGTIGDLRKAIQPREIIYDDKGAPWCPQCFATNSQRRVFGKAFSRVDTSPKPNMGRAPMTTNF